MTAQKSTTRRPALTYGDDRLHALQRSTLRYFWEETNPENGLINNTSAGDVPASVAGVDIEIFPRRVRPRVLHVCRKPDRTPLHRRRTFRVDSVLREFGAGRRVENSETGLMRGRRRERLCLFGHRKGASEDSRTKQPPQP